MCAKGMGFHLTAIEVNWVLRISHLFQAYAKEANELYATETAKYCENTANPYDRPAAGNKFIFADIQGTKYC